jgi:hypothetical protein
MLLVRTWGLVRLRRHNSTFPGRRYQSLPGAVKLMGHRRKYESWRRGLPHERGRNNPTVSRLPFCPGRERHFSLNEIRAVGVF